MLNLYWLEQGKSDVPESNDWLGARDLDRMNSMRFEKRRADWRLGRWTAKLAVAAYLNLPSNSLSLSAIEIQPSPSGAPDVFLADEQPEVTVSISHRGGIAICAVAASGAEMGCDLEIVEPRIDSFVADYFTPDEQDLVSRAGAANRFTLLALLWSAKESALKAMRVGLRVDTRTLAVTPSVCVSALGSDCRRKVEREDNLALALQRSGASIAWHPLQVHIADNRFFHGWWQQANGIVRTMVANPVPFQPISMVEEGHIFQL
jgi:4'-phosphopantetheinyl transferase